MKQLFFLLPLVAAAPVVAQDTQASAAAKFRREFRASDADKDGFLSRPEVQARIGRMSAGAKSVDPVHAKRLGDLWFDAADSDRDGKVSEAEAQRLLTATFKRYDVDGDGRIEPGEREAAKKSLSK
ncbi:Ca2+-binding EF-hand superfamily protein [Sphingomonas jinjuensis]|uniref:Ca2+-binding EF-hand superfamily protein n=1 Tax=Sphingomonas jinjuensis TaxID=535907 RepID=A0A840FDM9_9SPHN|nr:EF-hand domain-containing protein [Sphingomonas jinjuensis]MBB4154762.1 Ca2+-binding EF-hand superfamily protein [Sphingomonas jinjuensis]